MLNFYVAAAEINTTNNRKKGDYLHLATGGIIGAMAAGGLTWMTALVSMWVTR